MTIFGFGAGYSVKAFAAANPGETDITGTTRSAEKFAALEQAGIRPLVFDGTTITQSIANALAITTHLIVSIAPGDTGDPVLRAAASHLRTMPSLQWIGYLSTVGVYGDHQGDWVDEDGACRPVSRRSVARLEAEQQWQALAVEISCPLAILRLSGIYGPGRNALVNVANGTARRLIKPDQVFNRIHCDDIAGALWHLVKKNEGGIFNVTDDLPAPPQDVVAYAAACMGVEAPPEIDFATAELSPMARSFYGENKRVSNAQIKAAGYQFRYPDYQTALDHMWQEETWRGTGTTDSRSPMRPG
ncbi:DUF1731 domain-containing protein [Mesorhizobium sp. NBSH29]|uniref:SDR family NAD(P)-dependent oxidoreductase n=1 Tax=Mesorhizobium sp. NBSH29 TaxID=2654249 RepID=UPI0018969FD1|nr:SDR family NAD(P)-dependent oxidoreductase [Mesorhizobium sp. NBSH29]QPC86287.1 DUF1731 domain-containing protein [Mesorhizobium sp. NBSH29]